MVACGDTTDRADITTDVLVLDVPVDELGVDAHTEALHEPVDTIPDVDTSVSDGDAHVAEETTDVELVDVAVQLDALVEEVTPHDTDTYDEEILCEESPLFDYSCVATEPETCPGGVCLFGMCIGPKLDPDRWEDCGDSVCGPCETSESCPADCGEAPEIIGTKLYDDPATITVFIHGFKKKKTSEMETLVYGADLPCDELLLNMQALGVDRQCGNTPETETDPSQLATVEYYGTIPAPWLTDEEVTAIEAWPLDGPGTALGRYARIVAAWIRHKLEISGASYVNVACSSMGCLITRYLVEHDLEGLATEGRIVKWLTTVGVIAGARLARAYDNPIIQETAYLLGIETNDFVHLNPDYVQDHACTWDHALYEGNNPLWSGTLIHHVGGTDPRIEAALGFKLLELKNPDDEPNDGIMFTFDEHFHLQAPEASFVTLAGEPMPATHSFLHLDHGGVRVSDGAAILGVAAFFHRRKVSVKLETLALTDDLEKYETFDGKHGVPPADVVPELLVRYDPFVSETLGLDAVIHESTWEDRTAPIITLAAGHEGTFHLELFAAPVMDEMEALTLSLTLLEVDWYPRVGLEEWKLDKWDTMLTFEGVIPLEDHVFTASSDIATATLSVTVTECY